MTASRTAARTVPFAFVDVFADRPLTGNPLSLVPDADDLDEAQMRAIAREFNQSETTFLLRPTSPGATWRLRSFTPIGAEVFGAGHNALGAWLWLAAAGRLSSGAGGYHQEIGDDVLPVEITTTADGRPAVSMHQSPPHFGDVASERGDLAAALGLQPTDLADDDAQVVSTGAGHLLVPLVDRAAVDRAHPDAARLSAALARVGGEGCYVYTRDPVDPESDAYARFFNPTMGIAEDPATGTAAGPLAARLVAHGHSDGGRVVIDQGHAVGRPSRLLVTVTGDDIRLTGTGLVVASGTLSVG